MATRHPHEPLDHPRLHRPRLLDLRAERCVDGPMSVVEDWKLYLLPRGTLFSDKRCAMCGTFWWESEIPGGSPTWKDVYELFIDRGPCQECPTPEGERNGASMDTRRPRNGRLAVEPHGLRVDPVTRRRGAGPMAVIHNILHRIQEAAGRRVCVVCGCLTGNRFRPISFSLGRRFRHGRRVEAGEHPHGPIA